MQIQFTDGTTLIIFSYQPRAPVAPLHAADAGP